MEGPEVSFTARTLEYLACLKERDHDQRFYHQSLEQDDLGVARELLQWRDRWYEAGWRSDAFPESASRRLRDIADAGYPTYDGAAPSQAPDADIIVVHANNEQDTSPVLEEEFGKGLRIKHRWWFPEQAYRGLTLSKFVKSFGDRDSWRRAMDYFLYREVNFRLGSEDAFVFFSDEELRDFTPATRLPSLPNPLRVP